MTRIKTIIFSMSVTAGIFGVLIVNANQKTAVAYNDTKEIQKTAIRYALDEKPTAELKLEQLEWESKQPKKEEPQPQIESKEETQPVTLQHQAVSSSVRQRSFRMNNGTYQTGDYLVNYVKGNPNGLKMWQAFYNEFGEEVADTAAITLFYENGTLLATTTGVCSAKYQINGDYRNCVYADINSAGMDAGLKQINTYYQRYRIAKLGGPNCEPGNSRDITDPCTVSQVTWLHNVDNNVAIALDIYREQGFSPWYGYKKAFGV